MVLSALGPDGPGIAAEISDVLARAKISVEDSTMAILSGRLCMMLSLQAPDDLDFEGLIDELEFVRRDTRLEAISVEEVSDDDLAEPPSPTHVLSLYGPDKIGILAAVTAALAEREINVTDIQTTLRGNLFALAIEVAAPSLATVKLHRELAQTARDLGIELAVTAIDGASL